MGWFSRSRENLSILQDTEGEETQKSTETTDEVVESPSEPSKGGREYVIVKPLVETGESAPEQSPRSSEDYRVIGEQRIENAKQAVVNFKSNIAGKFSGLWQKAKRAVATGKNAATEAAVYAMSTPERMADSAKEAATFVASTPERVSDAASDAYEGVASKAKELYLSGQEKVEAGVSAFNEKKEAVLGAVEEKLNALEARAVEAKTKMFERIQAAKEAFEQKMTEMRENKLLKEMENLQTKQDSIKQRLEQIMQERATLGTLGNEEAVEAGNTI